MTEVTLQQCLDAIYEIADKVGMPGKEHRNLDACYNKLSKSLEPPEPPKEE